MKRIIAVLLTLMMALSLTACSGDDNAKVAGTWKWNCDMTEMFQEGVNQGPDGPVHGRHHGDGVCAEAERGRHHIR